MMIFQILIYLMLLLISILMLSACNARILWFFGCTKEDVLILEAEVFGPLKWIHLVFRMRDMTTNELNLKVPWHSYKNYGQKKHPHIEEKTKGCQKHKNL